MHRGVGALLVLLGSAMVYEGSAQARSPVGAGLGLLLVLTGSSLVLDPPAEAKQTARQVSVGGHRPACSA